MTKADFEFLGTEMASFLGDVRFDGLIQSQGDQPITCQFTCLKTGASFATNMITDAEQRLKSIRSEFPIK